MQMVKCLDKLVGQRSGKLEAFILQDTSTGKITIASVRDVKNALANHQIEIVNLKISANGRTTYAKEDKSIDTLEFRKLFLHNLSTSVKNRFYSMNNQLDCFQHRVPMLVEVNEGTGSGFFRNPSLFIKRNYMFAVYNSEEYAKYTKGKLDIMPGQEVDIQFLKKFPEIMKVINQNSVKRLTPHYRKYRAEEGIGLDHSGFYYYGCLTVEIPKLTQNTAKEVAHQFCSTAKS